MESSPQAQWHVSLLGGLRVQPAGRRETRVRSKKAGGLLAYLAYFKGQAFSREVLVDLFWPDGDIDTGRQSLRAALATIRREFEGPGFEGSLLMADRDGAWVNADAVTTDVAIFQAAAARAEHLSDPGERARVLLEGLAVVKGPILPGHDAAWILPQQLSLEEQYAQAVGKACDALCLAGQPDEAVQTAKTALTLFPLREDLHIAVMRSQAKAGRPTEAIRQFEELERLLDDHWGEQPSAEAVRALDELPTAVERTKKTHVDGQTPQPTGPKLPARLSTFIGRTDEIAHLVEVLASTEASPNRLVTLLGPGGCGKTRLALEVARELQDDFHGRAWHVSLAETGDPTLIPGEVRAAMGIASSPQSDALAQLGGFLGSDRALVILDNFEHLVDGGDQVVSDLLSMCPGLRCLATSRRPLHVEGERVFPVQPLGLPGTDLSIEALGSCDSVRLFVDRAKAVSPGFRLQRDNAEAVSELCRRLDGLPLALELAASRVATATPARILARLGEQSDFLTNRVRNTPERHRSLKATVDWSVDLLQSDEAEMFRRCGVFRGGWTTEAARAVCPGSDPEPILDTLVENSLVVAVPGDTATRFSMLEPIREHALGLLRATGDKEEARSRHLDYFADLAETLGTALNGPDQAEAANEIEVEMDNLREAVVWATRQKTCPEAALRLVGAIRTFFGYRGHMELWHDYVDRLLLLPHSGAGTPRAVALMCAGALRYYRSDFAGCGTAYEEARAVSGKAKDASLVAEAVTGQGIARRASGDFEAATKLYTEAIALCDAERSPGLASRIRYNLGSLNEFCEKFPEAAEQFRESLRLAEEVGDTRLIARNQSALGRCALHDNDPETAIAHHSAGRALLAKVGDKIGETHVLGNIALLELTQGRPLAAAEMFADTLALSWEVQNLWDLRSNLVGLAHSLVQMKRFELAARVLGAIRAVGRLISAEMTRADIAMYDESLGLSVKKLGQRDLDRLVADAAAVPVGDAIKEISKAVKAPGASLQPASP